MYKNNHLGINITLNVNYVNNNFLILQNKFNNIKRLMKLTMIF